ncbi:Bacteriophage lambda NinG [uncultured Caudovirales phage]|uniref:Protein ninG n=1 Tax=uncultured Caudovirales phage TaxID=2100421 RepID=A0A6J5P9F4_9CAUD|nr:Bacteriophage lambda NinG [uncultured Caudovirales phage]
MKKCKQCGLRFTPSRPLQFLCSVECAIPYTLDRKGKPVKLPRVKRELTRADWLKKAQQVFNEYIRERDRGLPCISCQSVSAKQYHASHYRSVGAHPELRYCEFNVWSACQKCNLHLSGNLIEYRRNLVKKIGQEKLDWLEGPHEPKKYTIEELQGIVKEYREKVKKIKAGGN